MDEIFELPESPFFNCSEEEFSIHDAKVMKHDLSAPPLLSLKVALGNLFEQRPIQVSESTEGAVSVRCEGDVTVRLDFEDDIATKTSPDGEYRYKGGISDGNNGMGFMPS